MDPPLIHTSINGMGRVTTSAVAGALPDVPTTCRLHGYIRRVADPRHAWRCQLALVPGRWLRCAVVGGERDVRPFYANFNVGKLAVKANWLMGLSLFGCLGWVLSGRENRQQLPSSHLQEVSSMPELHFGPSCQPSNGKATSKPLLWLILTVQIWTIMCDSRRANHVVNILWC
jgi:hypothetical protein